jgi:hypothetical protein
MLRRAGPELSDDELAWTLGWPAPTSCGSGTACPDQRNRRHAARHSVSARASIRPSGDRAVDETVQLRNLSAGGVNALHARPMRPGDTFWITLRSADPRAASLARTIDRRCTVLRCERGGSGRALFSIAARFVA